MGLTCIHVEVNGTFAMGFNRERSNSNALPRDTGFCGEKHISEDGIPPRLPELNVINAAEA